MARTSSAPKASSRPAVYAALAGNLLVAGTKTVAAAWTGSSAMASEAVHSFVDSGNELLLLYGMHRAARRPDREHPAGHGRELSFWSFIVALLVFALGAGVSLYEGVVHIRHPEPITDPRVSYIVLGLLAGVAMLLAQESKSLLIGERADRRLAESVLRIAARVGAVAQANGVLTFQLGPDQIVVALSLEFKDDLRTPEIEAAVVEVERRVREAHPEVRTVFVKPQTPGTYREIVRRRYGEGETAGGDDS